MADDRDQLVDEQTMEKMSVAPPDPDNGQSSEQQMQSERPAEDRAADTGSGVDDDDPLSAHPT